MKLQKAIFSAVCVYAYAMTVTADILPWTDVIAFYPFDDQSSGVNASGATVNNLVDSSVGVGTVANGTGTGATATFDSEGPGKYVYSSSASMVPVYTNPASLHLAADPTSRGNVAGSVTFNNLGNKLAANANNHTFEYFFKLDNAAFGQYVSHLTISGGYVYSDGTVQAFNLYMPFADNSDAGRHFRYSIKYYDGNRNSAQKLAYDLWDGKWHHVAVVATNSIIEVWVDYKKYGSVKVDGTSEPNGTRNIKLGGPLHARYSCVRASSRALDAKGFLRVSDHLPTQIGGKDTFAFYPFDDQPNGTKAAAATVCNVICPAQNSGLIEPGTDATSQATFDTDAPGKYVFAGKGFPGVPVYTNPASIHLSAASSVNGKGGNITFSRLGNDFSAYREKGQTVEYFIKMDDNAIDPMRGHIQYGGGYKLSDGTRNDFFLYMPFSLSYDEGRQFRYAIKYYGSGSATTQVSDYPIFDGKWHHVAIVETNLTISVWLDYKQYGSISIAGTTNLSNVATDYNLNLGCNVHHAKYSCLKLTKCALGSKDFLRASNSVTYAPNIGFYWTFDGVEGEELASIVPNVADSLASLNPDVYGMVSGNGNVNGRSIYGGKLMYSHALVNDGLGGIMRTNEACAYFETQPLTSGFYRNGPFVMFAKTGEQADFLTGDFTIEGFFKFKRTGWLDIQDDLREDRDTLTLFAVNHRDSSIVTAWSCSIVNARRTPKFRLKSRSQDGESIETRFAGSQGGIFNDGKWHHIAVAYDKTSCCLIGYYDYEPVVTNQLSSPLGYSDNGNFYLGNGPAVNENAFHGWVDEVRLSRECLVSEQFLRQERVPYGLFMIIR